MLLVQDNSISLNGMFFYTKILLTLFELALFSFILNPGALQLANFPIPLAESKRGVSRMIGKVEDPDQRHYFKIEKNHPKYVATL